MKKKYLFMKREQGSIIVMTLLIFSVVCIFVLLVIQLSSQEMQMSKYYFRNQQAQQLVDAVIEQRCAEISQSLRTDYIDNQYIPSLPLGWQENCTEFSTGSGKGGCQTQFLSLEIGSDYCCYKIKCVGWFENASKSVEAEVTFRFQNNFNTGQEFLYRTFFDNGTITAYRILNNQ